MRERRRFHMHCQLKKQLRPAAGALEPTHTETDKHYQASPPSADRTGWRRIYRPRRRVDIITSPSPLQGDSKHMSENTTAKSTRLSAHGRFLPTSSAQRCLRQPSNLEGNLCSRFEAYGCQDAPRLAMPYQARYVRFTSILSTQHR